MTAAHAAAQGAACTTRVVVWIESWQWLILNLALIDAPFTIVEPADIRDACATFANRVVDAGGNGQAAPAISTRID